LQKVFGTGQNFRAFAEDAGVETVFVLGSCSEFKFCALVQKMPHQGLDISVTNMILQTEVNYFADGTPMENFYLPSGREILHRRYAGANAKLSRFYKFETLPEEGCFIFDNIEYRLWYDSLLMNR